MDRKYNFCLLKFFCNISLNFKFEAKACTGQVQNRFEDSIHSDIGLEKMYVESANQSFLRNALP